MAKIHFEEKILKSCKEVSLIYYECLLLNSKTTRSFRYDVEGQLRKPRLL
jgi:hypothetical protein